MITEKEEVLTDEMLNKLKGIGLEKELTALCIHIRDTQREAGKAEAIREEIDFLLGLADITSHISVDRLIAERVILLKSKIGALVKKQSLGELTTK